MASNVEGTSGAGESPRRRFGAQEPAVQEMLAALHKAQVTRRIWGRDASLWTDSRAEVLAIEDRLGWLDLPTTMPVEVARLQALRAELVAAASAPYSSPGRSSLAEVYREAFGGAEAAWTMPCFDTTDPPEICAREGYLLRRCSSSPAVRTTAETMAIPDFRERARCPGALRLGEALVAITDAQSLAALAQEMASAAVEPGRRGASSRAVLLGWCRGALLGFDIDAAGTAAQGGDACHLTRQGENPALLLGRMGGWPTQYPRPHGQADAADHSRLAFVPALVEQLIAEAPARTARDRARRREQRGHGPLVPTASGSTCAGGGRCAATMPLGPGGRPISR